MVGVAYEATKQAQEAKNINQSLTTLGRVILALRIKSKTVPFRESALTMLMKNSLVGNCRTMLVVTVAESSDMIHESISSLRFGMQCGALKNQVVKQTVDIGDRVATLTRSLKTLDSDLENMRAQGYAGGLNQEHPKPTRDQFIDNYAKLLKED